MKTLVVLTSGGTDSYIAYHLAKKKKGVRVIPIYIDIGHPYANVEWKTVKKLIPSCRKIRVAGMLSKSFRNMPSVHAPLIPGRNLLFSVIAATIGADIIWLSALKDEMHALNTDKNNIFFSKGTKCLSYVYSRFRPKVVIDSPLKKYDKSTSVAMALEMGITKKQIRATRSCFNTSKKHCGNCRACIRKWASFVDNDIRWDDYFLQPPAHSPAGKKYILKIKRCVREKDYSYYSLSRCKKLLTALKKANSE